MAKVSGGQSLDNFSVPPGDDTAFAKDIIKQHIQIRKTESDKIRDTVKSLDQAIDTHPKRSKSFAN